MANIAIEIADLESILTNFRGDHTEDELRLFEEDLARCRYIQGLWDQLGDIPIDPETECIKAPFVVPFRAHGPDETTSIHKVFDPETRREDIWHWFEQTFCISVAKDLMY